VGRNAHRYVSPPNAAFQAQPALPIAGRAAEADQPPFHGSPVGKRAARLLLLVFNVFNTFPASQYEWT
jgi:hypothetical protein